MKTKIVEVGGKQYQIRKMSPSAGSFIYFKMMGSMLNHTNNDVTTEEADRAKTAGSKMSPEEKARMLCVSTFMQGLDYQYVEFAQRQALMVTSRIINAGGAEAIIPVMRDDGRWVPPAPDEIDLQDEPAMVQQLTIEAVVFSIAGFFAEGQTKR